MATNREPTSYFACQLDQLYPMGFNDALAMSTWPSPIVLPILELEPIQQQARELAPIENPAKSRSYA
jgi:hypothetical protein